MEDARVFADTHRLILDLVARGIVDGLRIDHIDGLRDPETYLRRLRNTSGGAYVVVEKILESNERLPESWPVAGTTGYEFLNRVNNLFVDSRSESGAQRVLRALQRGNDDYEKIAHDAKLQIMYAGAGGRGRASTRRCWPTSARGTGAIAIIRAATCAMRCVR
jgi:(1->4)-alpha-D-glucan 1-alpha-D-glucosylmutase